MDKLSERGRADTIAALATPPGRGTQAIVRLSGPGAIEAIARLSAGERACEVREARAFRPLAAELSVGGVLLRARVLVSRAPRSYTREDTIEVCLPGAPALARLLLEALVGAEPSLGVRPARPGEFTLRAFLNGRLDLSQAESVAEFIAATSEDEARASARVLRGELRREVESLASRVTEALALLEAALDFPDEELPEVAPSNLMARVEGVAHAVGALRQRARLRASRGDSLRVLLCGFPNAGKSSLLNALLGRDAAIVCDQPGTTRDPVRGRTSVGDRWIEWVDLAGMTALDPLLGESGGVGAADSTEPAAALFGSAAGGDDTVWRIVARLTLAELEAADRLVWVVDASAPLEAPLAAFRNLDPARRLLVFQKIDRLARRDRRRLRRREERPVLVSAHLRVGLEELASRVLAGGVAPAGGHAGGAGAAGHHPPDFLLSAHQEAALALCAESLERARKSLAGDLGYEYVAADLRDGLRALEDLTGRVTADEVLDVVFSRFCIGK